MRSLTPIDAPYPTKLFYMKNSILLLLVFFAAFNFTDAQNISGTWTGKLELPTGHLTIVFHIKDSAGIQTGKMDSPDQHAFGIPVSKIGFNAPDLHIEVANGAIVYDGRVVSDSAQGNFKQSGQVFPLVLRRSDAQNKKINRPQEPKPPFPYRSEEVEFVNHKANGIQLAGTLTLPEKEKNFPAVVLISGSGAQDRDETIMEHRPFWVIADYLTRRGIAVLRFDDRGTAKSGGDFQGATSADFATDVEAAVQFLKSRKEIDARKIGLIGHSEGGIVAPMVSAKDKSIGFIVLMAAPGYSGADILLMQTNAIGSASGMTDEQLKAAAELNKKIYAYAMSSNKDSSTKQEIIRELMLHLPQNLTEKQKENMANAQVEQLMSPWMQYFLKKDPAEDLKKVKCPVLALSGSKDLQVPAEKNIVAIQKALKEGGNGNLTTKVFPGLNHLFQHADTGLPAEYHQIEETMAPEALEYMAEWIGKTSQ